MRADRLEDRTAENVATASTSVPTAVANDETTTQSTVRRTTRDQYASESAGYDVRRGDDRIDNSLHCRSNALKHLFRSPFSRSLARGVWYSTLTPASNATQKLANVGAHVHVGTL